MICLLVAVHQLSAACLSDIVNNGGDPQPSVSCAARPAPIDDEATRLKWKWRMDASDSATGLANGVLKATIAVGAPFGRTLELDLPPIGVVFRRLDR